VRTIRVKIADLFAFEGTAPVQNPELAVVTPLVLKQFGYLPRPVMVQIEGEEVVI